MPTDKLVVLLIDAFRHDYINAIDTPFLHRQIDQSLYARKLTTTCGFTQRTVIFSGQMGTNTGAYTVFSFDEEDSPFRFARGDQRLARFSREQHWTEQLGSSLFARVLRRLLATRHRQQRRDFLQWLRSESKKYATNAPTMCIPLEILPEIGVSEDVKPIHEAGGLAVESLFDVMIRAEIPYHYLMYPVVNCDDDGVVQALIDHRNEERFVLFSQFSEPDAQVHLCGPSDYRRRSVAGEIDRKLRELVDTFDDDTTWLLFADHGMTDVTTRLDIRGSLKSREQHHNVQFGRDYLLFLDSTLARFRWKTERGQRFIESLADDESLRKHGYFIDDEYASRFSLPLKDRCFGDLIWQANIGVLICPDYFRGQDSETNGMHGYNPDEEDMKGFAMVFGDKVTPRTIDTASLLDICPTVCDLLELDPPAGCEGRSILL